MNQAGNDEALEVLKRISHVLTTCQVRWEGDTVLANISALVTAGLSKVTPASENRTQEAPRRWADQYDFDKSDPATRLFVAASNWVDRCERAEEELARVKVERGELALKLAGAECFIEEQRKKGNIK